MYEHIRAFMLDDIKENGKKKCVIAEKMGYADSGLYGFLNGNLEPSKRFLECIADYYGMAVVYYKGEYRIVKGEHYADSSN